MKRTNTLRYWLAVIGIISLYLLTQCTEPSEFGDESNLVAGWVFEKAEAEFSVGEQTLDDYLETMGIAGESARKIKVQLIEKYNTDRMLLRFKENRTYISMIDTDIQDEGEWILDGDFLILISKVQGRIEYKLTSLTSRELRMDYSESVQVKFPNSSETENGNVISEKVEANVMYSFTKAFE